RGVIVRVHSKATPLTKERLLRLPIRLPTMPTLATGTAGVARVYKVDWHSGLRRLVGDILAQLEERPRMPLVAMFVSNRCSPPDSRQILKSDCLARYGGFLDELLADAVVGVALETGFAVAYLAQTALRVFRSHFLQSLAAQVIASAHNRNHFAG